MYKIDELDGINVYYTNGLVYIELVTESDLGLIISIKIKRKTLDSVLKTEAQIKIIFNHLKQIIQK